jgi:hypothetical protein
MWEGAEAGRVMAGRIAGWLCLMLGVIFAAAIAPLLASIRFATEEEEVMGAYLGSVLFFICAAVLLWGGTVFVQSARVAKGRILLGIGAAVALLSIAGMIAISKTMP